VQSVTVGSVGMGGFCERIVGGREMRRSKTSEVIAMVGGSEYREAMMCCFG